MSGEYEIEVATGRRSSDGHVHLALFTSDLLALSMGGPYDRTPTLLLTRDQALRLQSALGELIDLISEKSGERQPELRQWNGSDRRASD